MVFENIQKELSELVGLVRQSERWVRVTRPKRTKHHASCHCLGCVLQKGVGFVCAALPVRALVQVVLKKVL